MTKRQLINVIHGMLKTDCYSVLWADYYGSVDEGEFESRKRPYPQGYVIPSVSWSSITKVPPPGPTASTGRAKCSACGVCIEC